MATHQAPPPLVLVPAAGRGRRVGSPESKEMLPDEMGRPLIDWAIDHAFARGWPVHVIVRPEKRSLISHLQSRKKDGNLAIQKISGSMECSHSMILSRAHWHDRNILILPDTRWHPAGALDAIFAGLEHHAGVYGTFPVADPSPWGCVDFGPASVEISEKCSPHRPGLAWGLIGFRKSAGVSLLAAHLESVLSGKPQRVHEACAQVPLQDFVDLTRTGWPPEEGFQWLGGGAGQEQ